MRRVRVAAMAIAAVMVLLILAPRAWASGVQEAQAAFGSGDQPEPPLDRFAAGHLGLIEQAWNTVYLYVAYRYLAGRGFDPEEQKVLLAVFDAPAWPQPDPQPEQDWLAARAAIPDAPQVQTFEVFAPANDLDSFRNCNDNAFRTATATLASMVAKFGVDSPPVKQWLAAQDVVFENCPGSKDDPHIPEALKAGTSLERAQRDYQIACANFYSQNFDAAIEMFTAIAGDAGSPWRTIAPYLVARATLRKATLSGEKNDDALLAKAEQQLKAIVDGNSPDNLKASAQGLLGFVGCRIHPTERHGEAVGAILRPGSERTLAQALKDYRECAPTLQEGVYDLDDWLATMKSRGDLPHSVEKWKRSGSLAWLVASIAEVSGADSDAEALLKAAQQVRPDSPAHVTVEFHVNRILIEQGKTEEARVRLDSILAKPDELTRSAYNEFASMRFNLARSLDEYLKFAQRYPVGIDGGEEMIYVGSANFADAFTDAEKMRQLVSEPLLERDSTQVMNAWLPLSILTKIAHSTILPPSLRARVALSVWVRSILLHDETSARELTPMVADLIPALKPSLDAWLASKPDQRPFEIALMMLRNPGMRPYIGSGFGRVTPLDQMDYLRDNWWPAYNAVLPTPSPQASGSAITPPPIAKNPAFVSEAERESADREWTTLSAIDAPEFLCSETLRHASAKPDEARVPEALYRCIGAVHLGPASDRCNALAESAFHLLHNRYPKSEWAQKGRFWYHGSGSPWSPEAFGR